MKYLIIIHDVYQEDNHFPLGPAYIASILRENGHEVKVYCMDVYHYTNKQLAEYLDKNSFDYIAIGFMSARFVETILPLCKIINKYKKKAKLVLGGHGASATPEYILQKTGADSIIVGEAENIILDIGDGINIGKPVKNLDSLPLPAWDLFPMDIYTTNKKVLDMNDNDKFLMITSSRGCPNKCTFCYRMENGLRLRNMDRVVDEIKLLNKKYGVTYFEFADEFFSLSKNRLIDFNNSVDNLDIKYWCASRVKGVTEDILTIMKAGGCRFINYGFESMDNSVLKEMRKNTTSQDNENAAKLTKNAEIPFGVNMIWGFSNDTISSLWKSVDFIKKYNSPFQCRTIRPVTPYPGSQLYYDAIKKNLLEGPEDFYTKFKNSDLITVNFTDLNENEMYKQLYKANSELIKDYCKKANIPISEENNLIKDFYNLYFKKNFKFRGVRSYAK